MVRVAWPIARQAKVVSTRAGQAEGAGDEVVAQEDAGLVVPAGIDGVEVAAERGLVEDVVVNEGRGVDHFDGGGQRRWSRRSGPGDTGRQQQQGRPQPLAPQADPVFDQAVDEGMVAVEFLAEDLLDLIQFMGHGRIEVAKGIGGLGPWYGRTFHRRFPGTWGCNGD